MKKFLIGFIVFSLVLSIFPAVAYADVNAVTPSTNDINRTKGWAHVDEISKDIGEVTLQFTSTRAFYSCFEYRTDGDTSQGTGTNYNTDITDGLYPYFCTNNSTRTETIYANEYVEIRMVFGAERDERFDWTRFDVLPALEPIIPEPVIPEPEPIIPEPEPKPIIPEPCYCSLVVQVRDEGGHPINGSVLKVDGIEKRTVNGDARWDNLNCDTSYEVRELSPIEQTEGIHLGDCGERSTLRVVNEGEEYLVVAGIEEGELEVLGIMEVLPFTGPAIPYSPFIGISTVLAGAFLYILSKSKKKR